MNRTTLAKELSEKLDIPVTKATEILDLTLQIIEESLTSGNKVTLQNFGRFETRNSPATRRRNPRTGLLIDVPAKVAVGFSAAPELKTKVNGN